MPFSYKLVLIAAGGLLTLPGVALAADLAKGYYEIDGYITQSTCGVIPNLKAGSAADIWSYFPGANAKGFQMATPSTSSTGGAGDAETTVCVATTAVPAAGLNGANLLLNCYNDTGSGAQPLEDQLQSSFKVGASHSPLVWQVTVTNTLLVKKKAECSYTVDATWTEE